MLCEASFADSFLRFSRASVCSRGVFPSRESKNNRGSSPQIETQSRSKQAPRQTQFLYSLERNISRRARLLPVPHPGEGQYLYSSAGKTHGCTSCPRLKLSCLKLSCLKLSIPEKRARLDVAARNDCTWMKNEEKSYSLVYAPEPIATVFLRRSRHEQYSVN